MQAEDQDEEESGDEPAQWHLCWQAAVGRDFFAEPSLPERIRRRILEAHRKPGRILVDYLLTSTELHVVSKIDAGDSAGRIARGVGNVVSRWVRDAHLVRSPVLAGRFRAYRIHSSEALRVEVRMLAWRPVFLGVCSTPSHHRLGGLRIALGLTPAQGFDARPLLGLFADAVPQARASLRAWVAGRPSVRDVRHWELERGLVLANGTIDPRSIMVRDVRTGAAAALVAAGDSGRIDGALRLLEVWVNARLGVHGARADWRQQGPGGARGRALVACLAVDHRLCPAAAVARHFSRAKATLSEQMAACRKRPADRQILATPLQRLIEEALALLAERN